MSERATKGRLRGSVTSDEVERVMALERKRRGRDYRPGWTYHRCREECLLLAYEHTLGSYAEPSSKEYAPRRGRPLRDPEPLLRVEMTPESCFYKSARLAVGEARWAEIKAAVGHRAGYRCEVCLGRGRKYAVGCHAVFDYDHRAGVQTLSGFLALCPPCAGARHIGLAGAEGRHEIALGRLLMINRWTPEEADRYLEQADALFERRSRIEWTQDFSPAESCEFVELRREIGGRA